MGDERPWQRGSWARKCYWCGHYTRFWKKDIESDFKVRKQIERIERDDRNACPQCAKEKVCWENQPIPPEEQLAVARELCTLRAGRVWGWRYVSKLSDKRIMKILGDIRTTRWVGKKLDAFVEARRQRAMEILFQRQLEEQGGFDE